MGRLAVLTAVVAFLTWPSVTAADPPSARELFLGAKEAIREGRFAQAADMLTESLRLERRPSTAYNLAVAHRGTGNINEAIAQLDELLDGEYGRLSRGQRAEVSRLRRELKKDLSELSLVLRAPDAALVRVDGQDRGKATEGEVFRLKVNPGRRQLSVEARGYLPHEHSLKLYRGDRRTLEITLKSEEARLELVSEDASHWVEIVDIAKAQHRVVRELNPGTYQVRVSDNKRHHERAIDLNPGANTRVELDLPEVPLRKRPWFWVGLGLGAAAIGVGTYFLVRPGTKPAQTDGTFGVVRALRAQP